MELFFAIILTCLLAAVVAFDVTKFIIPNWINLAIIVVYPAFLLLVPNEIDVVSSLLVMLCFFLGMYPLFHFGVMGGGDVKLLIALSLWIGGQSDSLKMFGLYTSISGAVLGIFLIIIRKYLIMVSARMKKTPDYPKLFRAKEPMPYGLAISYAFGYLLWTDRVF